MTQAKPRLSAVLDNYRDPVVLVLGFTQTVGYGTLFYAYGVLAKPIVENFAISLELFFTIFTAGLLIGGLLAPLIGREIDRLGARSVMATGSAVAALALLVCALSPNIWIFGFGVIIAEIGACMVLYEAAFAALTQIYRYDARSRITAITLIAGFASTLFWPLTQFLNDAFGWRTTYAIYAIINGTACLAAHMLVLKSAKPLSTLIDRETDEREAKSVLSGSTRQRAIILYAGAICLSGMIYAALPLHMLTLITSAGFTSAQAAAIAMVMGPCQVIARIVEVLVGPRFDAMTTGSVALFMLPVSLLALLLSQSWSVAAILFAAFYGVSQGLISIARGTVPLQLFGVTGYGTLQGQITGLRFFLNAGAPALLAVLISRFSVEMTVAACLVVAVVSSLLFAALPRADRKSKPH